MNLRRKFINKEPSFGKELRADRSEHGAFTVVELAAVIAVLALLVVLVLPVLASSAERSRRAMCKNNLRQLAVMMTIYAGNNNGKIIRAKNSGGTPSTSVQVALDPVGSNQLAAVGLTFQTNSPIWTCPNRQGFPFFEPPYDQWIIGYQYFGGISTWMNPVGDFASLSPTNLNTARPYWTLAADTILRDGPAGAWGKWAPGRESALWTNAPPHHAVDSLRPQGGNQVFVDGSAQWIELEKMYFLHSWSPSFRLAYFYQDPKDFSPTLRSVLGTLRPQP